MHNKHTLTRADVQSQQVEHLVAFGHVPGKTKWLHFIYDIGLARITYRVRSLTASQEQVWYFDDMDQAIAGYNEQ